MILLSLRCFPKKLITTVNITRPRNYDFDQALIPFDVWPNGVDLTSILQKSILDENYATYYEQKITTGSRRKGVQHTLRLLSDCRNDRERSRAIFYLAILYQFEITHWYRQEHAELMHVSGFTVADLWSHPIRLVLPKTKALDQLESIIIEKRSRGFSPSRDKDDILSLIKIALASLIETIQLVEIIETPKETLVYLNAMKELAEKQRNDVMGKLDTRTELDNNYDNQHYKQFEWGSITDEKLSQLVWSHPTTKIASLYGISDVAIGKKCKAMGISKPTVGFWRKVETGLIPHPNGMPIASYSTTKSII